ncbi:MAG: CAP domain-containing protein [Bifidobacteriaceae bacterium]|nr:CAP domain-containing protein [Bifidobacteriaceae bacterium]
MKAILASFIAANAFGSSFLGSSADEPAPREQSTVSTTTTTSPSTPADPSTPTTPTAPEESYAKLKINALSQQEAVDAVTKEINRVRKANGLSELATAAHTQSNAQAWAARAARQNSTAHSAAGTTARVQESSEIIAQNYKTQTIGDIINSWLNSTQHKGLLLATNIDRMGVGIATNDTGFTYTVVQFNKIGAAD